MNTWMMRGARRGLVLLATGTIVSAGAAGASGQTQPPSARLPPGAIVQPLPRDDGGELRRHLTTLADNPRSVDALIGAGRAALGLDDGEAALSFFGRADQISPRDARIKAGMAAAMVRLEQPQPALALFGEAAALGAPEVEIAADRGLAFDMVGQPRRAQQDYALVLRQRDEPEVRRRMALSLAISGERDAALRAIDAQLRANDRAAWRVQAFVLALTGDAAGARRTAEGMMPPQAAQAMAPFLARLATLSPSQQAMAVHFGHFPSDGRTRESGLAGDRSADPGAVALAMGGAPRPPAASTQPARQPETEPNPRRRPGRSEALDSSDPYGLRGTRRTTRRQQRAAAQPATQPPAQPTTAPARPPAQVAQAETRWAGAPVVPPAGPPQPALRSTATEPPPQPPPQPAAATASMVGDTEIAPGFSLDRSVPAPTQADEGLADIAALVNALPAETGSRPAPPEPARTAPSRPAPARAVETRAAAQRPAPRAHPSRHWVQIAGGADRSALPREFARLREQAPAELGRRQAYTAPLRATNRLLVGPFASAREAQEFVNALARRDVAAFAWTSEAGQEIERLQIGR